MSGQVTIRDSNGTSSNRPYPRRTVSPPVDVFESEDEVLVVADVPGMPGDAIDLRVENDTLTLETHRTPDNDSTAPALLREYDEVDFARSFRLPAGIDTANIVAEAKNGTIAVRLPKAAAAKPRKVTVRSA
jgi:HSP20 family protein